MQSTHSLIRRIKNNHIIAYKDGNCCYEFSGEICKSTYFQGEKNE